jgi:WD40 repeat protein
MAKRPQDRYPTAAALADDLRRWLRAEPVAARRIGPIGRGVRWCRRNPKVAAVTAAAAAIILTLSGLYAWSLNGALRDAERQRDDAVAAQEESQDSLCVSRFEQARMLLASEQPGRRWQVLDWLSEAERLQGRPRRTGRSPRVKLPSRLELRNLAVTALLTDDYRVRKEWSGRPLALSSDCRWAVFSRLDGPQHRVCRLVSLAEDRELPLVLWSGGEDEGPTTAAISPDGARVAISDGFQEATLWSVSDGKKRQLSLIPAGEKPEFENLAMWCRYLAFSADGSRLFGVRRNEGGSQQGFGLQVLTWDVKEGNEPNLELEKLLGGVKPEVSLQELDARVGSCAFSPDGGLFASMNRWNDVVVWDLKHGAVRLLPLDWGEVSGDWDSAMTFSPDGSKLAARIGPYLRLWDLGTNAEPVRIWASEHESAVVRLAFSRDSRLMAEIDSEGRIKFLDLAGMPMQVCVQVTGPTNDVFGWHEDGRAVFTGTVRRLLLCEPAWDRPGAVIGPTTWPHVPTETIAFSPDGRWRATTTWVEYGTVQVADRKTGAVRRLQAFPKPRDNVPGSSPPIAGEFRADGRQLAVTTYRGCVVFDFEHEQEVARVDVPGDMASTAFITGGAFNPAGEWLYVHRLYDRNTRKTRSAIKNLATGEVVWELPEDSASRIAQLFQGGRLLLTYPSLTSPFADKCLYSAPQFSPGQIRVWDVKTKREVGRLQAAGEDVVGPPTISADGHWLFTPTKSEGIGQEVRGYLWSIPEGRMRWKLSGSEEIQACVFSADNRLMVFKDSGGFRLCDGESGEELFSFSAIFDSWDNLRFTPDGRYIVSGGSNNQPELHLLDLPALRSRLAEMHLDW